MTAVSASGFNAAGEYHWKDPTMQTTVDRVGRLAELAHCRRPDTDDNSGARWLRRTACRLPEILREHSAGHTLDSLIQLHAHMAVEDPATDPMAVAADLHVDAVIAGRTSLFSAETALLPYARVLLQELTREMP